MRRKDGGTEAVSGQAAPYLLLERDQNSRIYQVFAATDRFCFIYVGNEVTGVDPEKISDTLPGADSAAFGDKSFTLEYGQISRLEFKPVRTPFTYIANSGTVTIYSPRKQTYAIVGDMPPETVVQFFKDVEERVSVDRKKTPQKTKEEEELDVKARNRSREHWDPKRYRILRSAARILKAAGGLSFFALILSFYPDIFSALCFICFFTAFIPAALWPRYFSMNPDKWGEKDRQIELLGLLGFSGAGMGVYMLEHNYGICAYAAGWVTGLLLSAVLIWRLREHHGRTGRKLLTCFLMLIFSVGIPAQVNTMLDFSEPAMEQVEVVGTYIAGGKYKRYEVKVRTDDGAEYRLKVSRSVYRSAEEGMRAGMEVYRGALGMRYACGYGGIPRGTRNAVCQVYTFVSGRDG